MVYRQDAVLDNAYNLHSLLFQTQRLAIKPWMNPTSCQRLAYKTRAVVIMPSMEQWYAGRKSWDGEMGLYCIGVCGTVYLLLRQRLVCLMDKAPPS